MVNERELIRRAVSGDIGAFEQIVTIYEKKIYNMAYRNLGNEQDAMDVSQEVFLRVFRFLNSFKAESSFSTWIYRITMNICKDSLKKRKTSSSFSLTSMENDEEYEMEISDIRYNPENEYERKELSERLRAGIDSLNPLYREVLLLREIGGKSYFEISEILSLDIGTVKSRIARGRESLRKYLSDIGTF